MSRAPRPPMPERRARMLRRLGYVIALAVVLSGGTIARAEPDWVMVPGAGVGRVTLGMKGPDLIAILGAPKAYCSISADRGEQQDVTVLYYTNRGLAFTLSATRGAVATVSRIHVVAGYSATLSDEISTGVNGNGYRKCMPHGTLTLDVTPDTYITSNGIGPGSSETDVVAKFGRPKTVYPAVAAGERTLSAAAAESLRLHRLLLLPYRAQVLAYDGIVFGIYENTVVAITIDWTGFDPYRYVVAQTPQ